MRRYLSALVLGLALVVGGGLLGPDIRTERASGDATPVAAPVVRVATWNVNHDNRARHVAPRLRALLAAPTDILILQEVRGSSRITPWLRARGLGVYARPEFAIAWNRVEWKFVRGRSVVLSTHDYWNTENRGLIALLEDRETGLRLKVLDQHLPAHIQVPRHRTWEDVFRVSHEAAHTWNKIVDRSRMAVLIAGDSNVDTRKGWAPPRGWGYLTDPPLHLWRAPKPTHGHRRIDDFRSVGLWALTSGSVWPRGPSDHRPYRRVYTLHRR